MAIRQTMVFRRVCLASVAMLATLASEVSAQLFSEGAREIRCGKREAVAKRILATPSVTESMVTEACKAVGVALTAFEKTVKSHKIDSLVITRHDFPTLETTSVNAVYQIGSHFADKGYWECVVDRKTWLATVQFRESR